MRKPLILGLPVLCLLCLSACRPSVPVPKPRAYYKIELPDRAYQAFNRDSFPYSFEFPAYAEVLQDQQLVEKEQSPYWVNVVFPDFNATIYLSYKSIGKEESLAKLMDESYRLSFAHDIRADYIQTPQFQTPQGLVGVLYEVGGDAASPYQFFLTDTTRHFIRGALYFNVTPNADSLAPVIGFLKKDMDHLIETFRFR